MPRNVRAIPGNGIVTIVWERPDTGSTYRVYRSTTRGTTGTTPLASYDTPPYPQLGGLPREDALDFLGAYGDTTVTNGTTYYYQISAVRNGTEDVKSAEVQAQPVAATSAIVKTRFLKLMPMGNSITAGWETVGGWRKPLIGHLRADGYNALLVGSCNSLSEGMDDPYHEGYGARVVYDDFPNARRALPVHDPDVLLLTIGTNNLVYWGSDPVGVSLKDYRELMGIIFSVKPNIFVMAAPVPPLSGSPSTFVRPYNNGIKQIVDSLKALGKRIEYVWELDSLTQSDLADGIHPSQTGYNKMGRYWFQGIRRITQSASFASQEGPSESTGKPAIVEFRQGRIVLSAGIRDAASVEVFTIDGSRVVHIDPGNGTPLPSLSPRPGSYLVAVTTRDGRQSRAVCVVR